MAKADHLFQVKEGDYYDIPCRCHPETCNCGGFRLVKKSKKYDVKRRTNFRTKSS